MRLTERINSKLLRPSERCCEILWLRAPALAGPATLMRCGSLLRHQSGHDLVVLSHVVRDELRAEDARYRSWLLSDHHHRSL